MSCRIVLLVLEEHLQKAIEETSKELIQFGKIHKIPFEGKYLLDYKVTASYKGTEALMRLRDRGVAFNAYGLNYTWAVRFTHLGSAYSTNVLSTEDVALNTYELLRSRLWPDGCNTATAEMRAHCVAMRFEWEDQAKYGRMHAMLNLLGN